MTLIARLATAATVLVATHSVWTGTAKAEHHATQMSATYQQKSTVKRPIHRQYGWPSYLLSFPPARSR
jgi:hypothetical protein